MVSTYKPWPISPYDADYTMRFLRSALPVLGKRLTLWCEPISWVPLQSSNLPAHYRAIHTRAGDERSEVGKSKAP